MFSINTAVTRVSLNQIDKSLNSKVVNRKSVDSDFARSDRKSIKSHLSQQYSSDQVILCILILHYTKCYDQNIAQAVAHWTLTSNGCEFEHHCEEKVV